MSRSARTSESKNLVRLGATSRFKCSGPGRACKTTRVPQRGRAGRQRQGCASAGAAAESSQVGTGDGSARSRRTPRRAVRDPGSGARPDPQRTDARVAVHVLSGSGAAHGSRPGVDAAVGRQRAAVRRRTPLELRRVRIARTAAHVRHQRLRRNASRSVGVGREATCRKLRDPGSRPRLRRLRPACDRQSGRRRIPERDAARGKHGDARCLVRPPRHRRGHGLGPHRGRRGTNWQEGGEGGGRGCREGEDARQHAGLREAGRRGRRKAQDRRGPPARRAVRRSDRPGDDSR